MTGHTVVDMKSMDETDNIMIVGIGMAIVMEIVETEDMEIALVTGMMIVGTAMVADSRANMTDCTTGMRAEGPTTGFQGMIATMTCRHEGTLIPLHVSMTHHHTPMILGPADIMVTFPQHGTLMISLQCDLGIQDILGMILDTLDTHLDTLGIHPGTLDLQLLGSTAQAEASPSPSASDLRGTVLAHLLGMVVALLMAALHTAALMVALHMVPLPLAAPHMGVLPTAAFHMVALLMAAPHIVALHMVALHMVAMAALHMVALHISVLCDISCTMQCIVPWKCKLLFTQESSSPVQSTELFSQGVLSLRLALPDLLTLQYPARACAISIFFVYCHEQLTTTSPSS